MPPALALIDVLPDFGGVAPLKASSGPWVDLEEPMPERRAPAPDRDVTTIVSAEVAAAEAALAERLAQEHAANLAEEQARHAEALQATQTALAEQAGRIIHDRFAEMERTVTSLASEATARILSVVLTRELQQRSVGELERIIRQALQDRETVRIRVSGAPVLWDALKAGLGDTASHVDFAEAPGLDISLSLDEKLFETRLAEWSDTLAELIP
ncbi:hypothetical protein [Nitratireductor pacificus]|uniref:Uncharacterized protein n=1 Tax=Nitratireductor pacificus pht-3B TaxID=391937 RepID=K2MYW3_9HYPH|nr:hypothetical protein [Nitratireductor pacificus]EKF17143.1 hypothetical protein NA2_19623 [Nitratireductor pacificus pht-3B]